MHSHVKEGVKDSSDLSNIGMSGGDYSPISHTFFKHPNATIVSIDEDLEKVT